MPQPKSRRRAASPEAAISPWWRQGAARKSLIEKDRGGDAQHDLKDDRPQTHQMVLTKPAS
jgi:hypothetical protein